MVRFLYVLGQVCAISAVLLLLGVALVVWDVIQGEGSDASWGLVGIFGGIALALGVASLLLQKAWQRAKRGN